MTAFFLILFDVFSGCRQIREIRNVFAKFRYWSCVSFSGQWKFSAEWTEWTNLVMHRCLHVTRKAWSRIRWFDWSSNQRTFDYFHFCLLKDSLRDYHDSWPRRSPGEFFSLMTRWWEERKRKARDNCKMKRTKSIIEPRHEKKTLMTSTSFCFSAGQSDVCQFDDVLYVSRRTKSGILREKQRSSCKSFAECVS